MHIINTPPIHEYYKSVGSVFLKLIMDFHLVLSLASALTFVFEFPVNTQINQDYFILSGNNQSAHLYRVNNSIYLYLNQGQNYSVYNSTTIRDSFRFSWNNFTVDGEKMQLDRSVGEVNMFQYTYSVFLSPILQVVDQYCVVNPLPVYNLNEVNYWYILSIVLLVGVALDSKTHIVKMINNFLLRRNKSDFSQALENVEELMV